MRRLILLLFLLFAAPAAAQQTETLLRPARVFDGTVTHEGW